MSILNQVIQSLANVGTFEKEVTIGEVTFVIRLLDNEQMMLADSLVDVEGYLKEASGGDREDLRVFNGTVERLRTLTRLAFIIKAVNGVSVVKAGSRKEQIEEIEDFRNDLLRLDSVVIDRLNDSYNQLLDERRAFFKEPAELSGK